ncbi:DJ-1/PfpI family protein [Deinococcus apachensis]|uniref:DJ-1/PfpI family protein n=1 Tax=Deinococcus apachensis TaxID=309886 RepID=UPI00038219B1|nr:DJ-1/PfpI family protein [Deinococcus apachensis]
MPIPNSTASESGRPQLALLVYPGFSEFEVTVALALLARTHDIVNVGLTLDPIRGEGGLRVLPDRTLADVQPEAFAAVLIPGAADMSVVADVPTLNVFVRAMHAQGKVIGAICGGPLVLGLAGLLDSIPYTVTFNTQQRAFLGVFPEAGFTYRDVVHAGHVITAQGHAFAEFGVTLAQALGAVRDVQGVRTFYRGLGNPGLEAEIGRAQAVSG